MAILSYHNNHKFMLYLFRIRCIILAVLALSCSADGCNNRKEHKTMNSHLEAAIDKTEKIKAVLNSIDDRFMEEAESDHQNLIYVLIDLVIALSNELYLLSQDKKVVDAIYAANDARCKSIPAISK